MMTSTRRTRVKQVEEEMQDEEAVAVAEESPHPRKSARTLTAPATNERTQASGSGAATVVPPSSRGVDGGTNKKFTDGEDDAEHNPDYDFIVKQHAQVLPHWREQPIAGDLSKEETDRLVSAVMRTMLFKRPESGPTTRDELVSVVSKNYKGKRNLANYILALAQAQFPAAFGLEMKEIEKTKKVSKDAKKRNQAEAAPPVKMYVLRSLLPCKMRRKFVELPKDQAFQSFTMMVLALIVTQGANETILEDQLWEHLASLGVVKGKKHPTFGDPEAMLLRLSKQRYLSKDKVNTNDGEQMQYQIAEVAHDEVPSAKIKAFIASVMTGEDEDRAGEEVMELN